MLLRFSLFLSAYSAAEEAEAQIGGHSAYVCGSVCIPAGRPLFPSPSLPPSLPAVSLSSSEAQRLMVGPKGQSEGYQFLSSDPSLNSLFLFIRRLSLLVVRWK